MIVFDDCYLCNWIMSDGAKGGNRWCGAGRREFTQDGLPSCPTRSEKCEIILPLSFHEGVIEWGAPHLKLTRPVVRWVKRYMPDTVTEDFPGFVYDNLEKRNGERGMLVTFTSPAKAIHFKMKWF